jgi:hypothetical protein
MNSALARFLIRIYPAAWRERYGTEFETLLLDGDKGLWTNVAAVANVAKLAIHEHIFPTQGGRMNRDPNSFGAVVRHPSALIPIAMSLIALALVAGPIPFDGVPVREADEGTIAHLFQILIAGQLPVLLFFAVKWLPRAPKPTLGVLGLQAGAVLAAITPVLYFNL